MQTKLTDRQLIRMLDLVAGGNQSGMEEKDPYFDGLNDYFVNGYGEQIKYTGPVIREEMQLRWLKSIKDMKDAELLSFYKSARKVAAWYASDGDTRMKEEVSRINEAGEELLIGGYRLAEIKKELDAREHVRRGKRDRLQRIRELKDKKRV